MDYSWNALNYEVDGLLLQTQTLTLKGKIELHDKTDQIYSRICITEKKGLLKMPDIKLNFWSKSEPKPEKKPPIKNEVLLRIFKRLKDHQKVVFSEGIGNYARFFQLDGLIVWSKNINNVPLQFQSEDPNDPHTIPSSASLCEIGDLIEANSTKEADEKMSEWTKLEDSDKELREKSKKKDGFKINPFN